MHGVTVSDTLIGTVSVYDPDAGDSITLSVSSPAFSLQNTHCAPLKVSLSARIALPSRSVCLHALHSPQGLSVCTHCTPLKVSVSEELALRSPEGQSV